MKWLFSNEHVHQCDKRLGIREMVTTVPPRHQLYSYHELDYGASMVFLEIHHLRGLPLSQINAILVQQDLKCNHTYPEHSYVHGCYFSHHSCEISNVYLSLCDSSILHGHIVVPRKYLRFML